MPTFFIGDLLTGRRIQFLQPLAGSWSEAVNDAGDVSVTVSLRNRAMRNLRLANSAAVGKAFLAVAEGETILQAGPIWDHDWDRDTGKLTLRGAGLLSYFDHRTLLPVLAGRLPSDATTDTRFMPAAPADPDYPWPTDTRSSLQGIMVSLFAQALSWPSGNVPLTLPSIIAGTSQRPYRGADLAPVGQRVREITQVSDGPEVRLTPQWLTDKSGISWLAEIGTPTQPLLFSNRRQVFYIGNDKSSVTKLRANVNGKSMGSQAYAAGGRSSDKTLTTVSTNAALTNAGYPLLELVDSSRSTIQDLATLQTVSDELVARGATPVSTWNFTHDLQSEPYLTSFRAGDFAEVRVIDDAYLEKKAYVMRILSRSTDVRGKKVDLIMGPAV